MVDLLVSHFGEDYGGYLLYNFTCFPCDDETAWRQAHALVGADRAGVFPGYIKAIEERQEQAMREAAGIA